MTTLAFDSFGDDVLRGNILVATDTFYVTLHTVAYVPNAGTHTKFSDVTNEVTGAGYIAGGQACTITLTKNTTTHKNIITMNTVSWANSTLSGVRQAVVRKRRGGLSSADELVCVFDNGADLATAGVTMIFAACTATLG